MSFVHTNVLVLAIATPFVVLALYFYDRARRNALASRIGELPVVKKVIASASPGRRLAKAILVGLGLGLVVFALARPQLGGKREVKLRGLDLVVAVDASKSMMVDDVGQTAAMQQKKIAASRLGRARELAVALIDSLDDDRVGPVVFAKVAAHFPLTEDREVAERFIYDLGPADLTPGSNLAEVFRVARCMLRPDLYDDLGCSRIGHRGHGGDPLPGDKVDPADKLEKEVITQDKEERGKALVVFTDGADPDEEAMKEVATSRELGIALIIVGVGSTGGGVVHEIDDDGKATSTPKRTRDGQAVVSKREDAPMRQLAEIGGDPNRYFIAAERGEVDPQPILEALRNVNRGLSTKQVWERHDIFQPFLFAGLVLLVIEAAISTRRRKLHPEEQ